MSSCKFQVKKVLRRNTSGLYSRHRDLGDGFNIKFQCSEVSRLSQRVLYRCIRSIRVV